MDPRCSSLKRSDNANPCVADHEFRDAFRVDGGIQALFPWSRALIAYCVVATRLACVAKHKGAAVTCRVLDRVLAELIDNEIGKANNIRIVEQRCGAQDLSEFRVSAPEVVSDIAYPLLVSDGSKGEYASQLAFTIWIRPVLWFFERKAMAHRQGIEVPTPQELAHPRDARHANSAGRLSHC